MPGESRLFPLTPTATVRNAAHQHKMALWQELGLPTPICMLYMFHMCAGSHACVCTCMWSPEFYIGCLPWFFSTPNFKLFSLKKKKTKLKHESTPETWGLFCFVYLSNRLALEYARLLHWRKLIIVLPAAMSFKSLLGYGWDFVSTPRSLSCISVWLELVWVLCMQPQPLDGHLLCLS